MIAVIAMHERRCHKVFTELNLVFDAPVGSWGGRCLSLAPHVTRIGAQKGAIATGGRSCLLSSSLRCWTVVRDGPAYRKVDADVLPAVRYLGGAMQTNLDVLDAFLKEHRRCGGLGGDGERA